MIRRKVALVVHSGLAFRWHLVMILAVEDRGGRDTDCTSLSGEQFRPPQHISTIHQDAT